MMIWPDVMIRRRRLMDPVRMMKFSHHNSDDHPGLISAMLYMKDFALGE
jgi:hypothetical protein